MSSAISSSPSVVDATKPKPRRPADYPPNGFGDFWQRKLRTSFRRMNRSGSGLLTRDDFRAIGDEMVRLGGLSGQRAEDVRAVMLRIWDDYYRPREGGSGISADQYVAQKCRMVNGPLRDDVTRYGQELFKAMDHNGDERISREEYRIFTEAWGIGDRARDEMFELMQRDGAVAKEDFLSALADFYISEDESSPYSRLFGDLC
uniref:EF-hand domain-containing protein n=1 Tax=Macrostomum lignano TaxID=282301 RepID=A0A1I8GS98_9PLAT